VYARLVCRFLLLLSVRFFFVAAAAAAAADFFFLVLDFLAVVTTTLLAVIVVIVVVSSITGATVSATVSGAAIATAGAVMSFAKWISMHDILLLIPLSPTTVSSSVPTVIDLVTRSPMSRLTSLATSAAVTMLRLPVAFITSSPVVLSLKSAGAIYSTAYFLPMGRTEGRTCGLDDGANMVFS